MYGQNKRGENMAPKGRPTQDKKDKRFENKATAIPLALDGGLR